ncbi:MAG TPA: hypothetical protein VF986_04365 [Actinomycetota bacterium]
MMRCALVASAAAVLVTLSGAPALAKGPLVPIPRRVVITGPGLKAPIAVKGRVYWYEYGVDGSKESSNEITLVVRELGLLQAGPDVGWYELPPDPSTLGPRYAVEYYSDTSLPSGVTLYPYAPGRPFVFSQGANVSGQKTGLWWSAPPALRTYLISVGLPSAPIAAPAPAQPVTATELPTGVVFPWAIALAVMGLLAMVVIAAVAGHRAQARMSQRA